MRQIGVMNREQQPTALNRRVLLTAVGTSVVTTLAGCATEPEDRAVELRASTPTIDLSELDTSQLQYYSAEDIVNEYSAEIELEIIDENGISLENGAEELDQIYIEIQDKPELQDKPEIQQYITQSEDTIRLQTTKIPGFLVRDGERVKIHAEQDGQELEAETTVEKVLPDSEETGYILEGHLWKDGEKVYETPHSDNFLFNTVHLDYEEYQEKRKETVEEYVRPDRYQEVVDEAMERKQDHEIQEAINLNDKIERDKQISNWLYTAANRIVGRHSSNANIQAATEEMLLRNLRQDSDGEIYFADTYNEDTENQIFTDTYANGLSNPHDQNSDRDGGHHGSKVLYIDGDWYHSETVRHEIKHVNNKEEIGMVNGRNQHYASIIGEMEQGGLSGVTYTSKRRSMMTALTAQTMTGGNLRGDDLTPTDEYAGKALDMKRDNEQRLDIYAPLIIGAEHHWNTGNNVIAAGTPENSELIAFREEEEEQPTFVKLLEDRGFQDKEAIRQEVLD